MRHDDGLDPEGPSDVGPGQDGARRSEGDGATLFEEEKPVAVLRCEVQVMENRDDDAVLAGKASSQSKRLVLMRDVEARGRLVEEQTPRLSRLPDLRQGTREMNALPLATRQRWVATFRER